MQNNHMLFPEEIYTNYLHIISNIRFTPREVDIISCVVSGKNPQAIANFLSSKNKPIELQTVNTHISNIRRKIDGSARGSIIEFIERSDKHQIMHKYYLSLLIQKEFDKSLKEITPIVISFIENLTIVTYKEEVHAVIAEGITERTKSTNIASLIIRLYKHLKLLSPSTLMEAEQHFTSISTLPHSSSEKHYAIHVLPLFTRNRSQNGNLPVTDVDDSLKTYSNTLLLLQGIENYTDDEKSEVSFEYIDINSQENYYFLLFEILIKLLPIIAPSLQVVIAKFKKRYESIYGTHNAPISIYDSESKNIEPKEEPQTTKPWYVNNIWLYMTAILVTVLVIGSGFITDWDFIQSSKDRENKYKIVEERINYFSERMNTDQTSTDKAKVNHSDILSVQQAIDDLYNKYQKSLSKAELQSKFNYLSCVLAGHYRYNRELNDISVDNYLKSQHILPRLWNNFNLEEFHNYVASSILNRALDYYNTRYGITETDTVEIIKDKLVRHTYALEDYILLNYYLSRGYMSSTTKLQKSAQGKLVERYLNIAVLGKEYNMFEACAAEKNKLIVERDKIKKPVLELKQKLKDLFPIVKKEESLAFIIDKIKLEKQNEENLQTTMEDFLRIYGGEELKLKEIINGFLKLENDDHKYINHYKPWNHLQEEFLIPKDALFNTAVMCKENLRTQAVLMNYYILVHYNNPQKLQQEQEECLSNSLNVLSRFLTHSKTQEKWEDAAIKAQRKMIGKAMKRLGIRYYDENISMKLQTIGEEIQSNIFAPNIIHDVNLIIKTISKIDIIS